MQSGAIVSSRAGCMLVHTKKTQPPRGPAKRGWVRSLASCSDRAGHFSRQRLGRSLLAAAILAGAAQAVYADYYWDPTHTAGSSGGGAGTWDLSTANWDANGTDVAWTNGNTADFGGTAGTVAVNASINAPTINFNSSGYILTFANSNTLQASTINVAPSDYAIIGANGATTGELNFNGLSVSGGGELILAQKVAGSGGITVAGGSTLTIGDRTLGTSASINPSTFLNGNGVNLNSSTLQIATSATLATTPFSIGTVNVSGTSTLTALRTSNNASASIDLANSNFTMAPGSTLIASAGANLTDNTGGAYFSTGSVLLNGSATLEVNTGTDAAGTYVEDLRLGAYNDGGYTSTFLGSGSATVLGGYIQLNSTYSGGGNWVIGSSNSANPQGVSMQLFDTGAQMTSGSSIIVNAYSQLFFNNNGTGVSNWGNSSQTITINGSFAPLTSGSLTAGALVFGDGTNGTNALASNVALGSSATINVNGAGTTADLKGNITGPSTALLTKGGAGTMALDGPLNTWSGGISIGNGIVQVNPGSALGSGPVTLASNTTPSSPSLVFNNANQTIGNLSGTFASNAAATNTVTLNSTALNIVETSATTFGNSTGYPTIQHSVITGTGSLSIDAGSTANLTLSSANTFTGPININGGGLLLTGSLTNTTAITVGDGTHAALLGSGNIAGSGGGSATGHVTVNANGTIFPGAATPSVGTTLSLPGGLTLNNNSNLTFDLDSPVDSDQIALGSGSLTLNGTINLNLNNIGSLSAGGVYPLITYSGSGPALGTNSQFHITGPSGANVNYAVSIDSVSGGYAVDLDVASNAPLYWAAGNGTWDFTSKNWKQSGNSVAFTNGQSVIFDDTGGSSSPITVTINSEVDPAETTFNNSSYNYILTGSGFIGGPGGLLVTGSGKVTLANSAANTFTGNVTINAGGTLIVSSDAALGNGTIVSLSNASTLEFNGTTTDTRTFTLGTPFGGTFDVTAGNVATLNGPIGGAGALNKSDTGTLVLGGGLNNTYSGSTNLFAGTIQIAKSGSIPDTGQVEVSDGTVLDLQTYTDLMYDLVESSGGQVNIGAGGNLNINGAATFSGIISGAGSLTNSGDQQISLSAASTSATFGNLNITGGGLVYGGQGQLGTGTITLTTAGSTLMFMSDYTSTQIVNSTTTNTDLNLNGHNVSLGALNGTDTAVSGIVGMNIVDGGSLTLTGTSGTANGVTIGASSDQTTVIVTHADANGISGLGSGTVTVQNGSTLEFDNTAGSGTLVVGVTGQTLTTVTLNGTSTLEAVGTVQYTGSTSPAIGVSANTNFLAPNSSDRLIIGSAVRNAAGSLTNGSQDTSNAINVSGNGVVQIASGGVSPTTITQFAGVWNVNNGILLFEGTTGGTGEVLNAPGYATDANYAASNTINLNVGTVAFGADMNNPWATAPTTGLLLNGMNSFRSPIIASGGALASAGFEYNESNVQGSAGIVFNTTPVTANFDGDLTINGNSTLTVDTYDPVPGEGGGARNINFATDTFNVDQANPYDPTNEYPIVTGNITWGGGSQLVTNSGEYFGGALNIARVPLNVEGTLGGQVSVGSGASITIGIGTTVNVGKDLPPGTGSVLTAVPTSIDPFTDSSVSADPTDSDTSMSLAAAISGTLDYAARTGQTNVYGISGNNDTGIKVYRLSALTVDGGNVILDDAAANGDANGHADRTLLVLGSLSFFTIHTLGPDLIASLPSGMDIGVNDVLVHNGDLADLTANIKAGLSGVTGIYSSSASLAAGTAVGIVAGSAYGQGDSSPPTTFDGMSVASSDVLIKYTYMGDTNLDGVVNSADLANLNYGAAHGLSGWVNGDLNYDGVINSDDYSLFALGDARQGASLASVPEPAALSAVALPLLVIRRRRRS